MENKTGETDNPEDVVVEDAENIEQESAEAIGEQGDAADQNSAEGAEAEGSELSPEAQIEKLNEDLQAAKDQALRTAAEAQNQRRRAERDVENAHKYGQEKLISALLPVLDNLDRALDAATKGEDDEQSDAMKSIVEGVELTRKSALDALKGFSVDVLEPYGEPFDPQQHEAMTMVPSDTAEPNSVIDVLQKGYSLNGRLLRAAMVVVAKAAE